MTTVETAIALLTLAFLSNCGCHISPQRALEAVESFGMTEPEVGSPTWLGGHCGGDDIVGRHVSAVNASGNRVDVVVCCGHFKSCTVRM